MNKIKFILGCIFASIALYILLVNGIGGDYKLHITEVQETTTVKFVYVNNVQTDSSISYEYRVKGYVFDSTIIDSSTIKSDVALKLEKSQVITVKYGNRPKTKYYLLMLLVYVVSVLLAGTFMVLAITSYRRKYDRTGNV